VLAGLGAVGASPAQAASGLLVLCLAQAPLAVALSWRHRVPLSFSWSTPGAALLVAGHGAGDFRTACGAFLVSGLLVLLTGAWPALARALTAVPSSLTGALLAGILLPLCLAPVHASVETPLLALPVVALWLAMQRFAPRWAVPAALALAIVLVVSSSDTSPGAVAWRPQLDGIGISWDASAILGLGVPLYLVTMASQNVPGIAMLQSYGYRVPIRSVLVGAGLTSAATAPFGGHAVNLVALSAAITAGPDAHPDPARRWASSLSSAATYVLLGVTAGPVATIVGSSPLLIEAVAGLALLGALATGFVTAFSDPRHRTAAALTFLVASSGTTVAGIGGAFWALLVGGLALWCLTPRRRDAAAR
jgi:benzoate membrane transport protein